jgi:hypothetical protein
MVDKVDFKKSLKQLYNPSEKDMHIVDVPGMKFLMVDGQGNPNTSLQYQQAIEVLYSMSYGIKFALKSLGYDHVIPPLEGLWWMENMKEFNRENIDQWNWTMMIMQPDWVSPETVESVKATVGKKKANSNVERVRYEKYIEGLVVQKLYFGEYKNEAPVIKDIHTYISFNGYVTNGKHHEIYLSDIRKTPADRLQTILRQPIRRGDNYK